MTDQKFPVRLSMIDLKILEMARRIGYEVALKSLESGAIQDDLRGTVEELKKRVATLEEKLRVVPSDESDVFGNLPEQVRGRTDTAKALYAMLEKQEGEWLDPSIIAHKIKETFPITFKNRSEGQIARGFPFAGMFLEKAGLIEIKRNEWGRRSYRKKI